MAKLGHSSMAECCRIGRLLQGTISFSLSLLLHSYLVESALLGATYLSNLALRTYCKLGLVREADYLFRSMPNPNAVSWNTLLASHVHRGDVDKASMIFPSTAPTRNVVTWNTLIVGHARQGNCTEAMALLQRMHQESKMPNDVTFLGILTGCGKPKDLRIGKLMHLYVNEGGGDMSESATRSRTGSISRTKIGTALVDMYGKCGDLESARRMFDELEEHDVASWTAMICAYSQLGCAAFAMVLFRQMNEQGSVANNLTLAALLSAISRDVSLACGKQVHAHAILAGPNLNVDVASALIHMYGKCGSINEAWLVFENLDACPLIVWNAMIVACLDKTQNLLALLLFKEMLLKGLNPNEYTFASALAACTCLMDLMLAMLIHSFVVEEGYMADVVINNAFINLYGKLGELENAEYIFRKMTDRSVGACTCMIMIYSQWEQDQEALELFHDMLVDKQALNEVIAVATLNACANFAAVDVGRMIHAWITIDDVLENKINIANSLMNMYGKCGDFIDVCSMFDRLPLRNIVSWNTVMSAYAQGGYGQQALRCLIDFMVQKHVKPDEFSCVSLLSSLSHSGMVDEGACCFTWLVSSYPSLLTPEQCVSMVDLFGRAGQLYEAEKLICNLPILPDTSLWSAFLAPCRAAGCKEWITYSVDCVLELDR